MGQHLNELVVGTALDRRRRDRHIEQPRANADHSAARRARLHVHLKANRGILDLQLEVAHGWPRVRGAFERQVLASLRVPARQRYGPATSPGSSVRPLGRAGWFGAAAVLNCPTRRSGCSGAACALSRRHRFLPELRRVLVNQSRGRPDRAVRRVAASLERISGCGFGILPEPRQCAGRGKPQGPLSRKPDNGRYSCSLI